MMSIKVIVIGAGLAGSLLANGLMRNDIDFMLYERDEKNALNREGYQIRIGDGALSGFRACLDPSRYEELMKLFGPCGSFTSSSPVLYDIRGNCLLNLGRLPWSTKTACLDRVVLRDFLTEPVFEAGKILYGKKFNRYMIVRSPDKLDRVRAEFEDGSTDEGDILVSAEGAYSAINSQVGLNNLVQSTSHWQFLSRGKISQEKLQRLMGDNQDSPLLVFHKNKRLWFSAYKTFTQPPHEKEPPTISAFCSLKIPSEQLPSSGARAINNKLQFCLDHMSAWDPKFHDLLTTISSIPNSISAFHERASVPPSSNWRQVARTLSIPERGHPRVWLIGDAVHAMLTQRGQGGNQSMADAADLLSELLTMLAAPSSQNSALTNTAINAAVLAYEKKMLPRAFSWVKASGGTGGPLPDPSGWKGTMGIYVANRVFDLMSLPGMVVKMLLG